MFHDIVEAGEADVSDIKLADILRKHKFEYGVALVRQSSKASKFLNYLGHSYGSEIDGFDNRKVSHSQNKDKFASPIIDDLEELS